MRSAYPSDISREQFEVIRYILESDRKTTCPRTYDLYDVFCAILYILKEGYRWRSLPHDFPKWNNVYNHYQIWSEKDKDGKSILDRTLEELVLSERIINGRQSEATMTIVDSKSVKNAFTAEEKGYDGGKKISGIKIHLGVDILGLPNGIHVTTANVTDCDGGYTGEPFANAIKALLDAAVEVVKRNELHKFAVIPKRWIVERSFSWLDNFRRLWKNCERKLHNTHQLVTLAFISVLLKRY